MIEIISQKGVKLISGTLFNWVKESVYYISENPYILQIFISDIDHMFLATYYYEKNYISFEALHEGCSAFKFYVKDMLDAEKMVFNFIKANELEMPELYKKK